MKQYRLKRTLVAEVPCSEMAEQPNLLATAFSLRNSAPAHSHIRLPDGEKRRQIGLKRLSRWRKADTVNNLRVLICRSRFNQIGSPMQFCLIGGCLGGRCQTARELFPCSRLVPRGRLMCIPLADVVRFPSQMSEIHQPSSVATS